MRPVRPTLTLLAALLACSCSAPPDETVAHAGSAVTALPPHTPPLGTLDPIQPVDMSEALFFATYGAPLGTLARVQTFTSAADFEQNLFQPQRAHLAPLLEVEVLGYFANGGGQLSIALVDPASGLAGAVSALTPQAASAKLVAFPGATDLATDQALLSRCAAIRCFALLDSPSPTDATQARALAAELPSSAGALYFPWVTAPGAGQATVQAPPSGFIAGAIAANDANRGVFRAPANLSLQGVVGLTASISTAEESVLVAASVNPLRVFAGRGPLIWGARTLSTDPTWRYISVVRLIDQIALSVQAGLARFAFEPDDVATWNAAHALVGTFLSGYFQSGALAGTTPAQAYFARCDRTTMTANDIANGRLIVLLGVAPIELAEFYPLAITEQVTP